MIKILIKYWWVLAIAAVVVFAVFTLSFGFNKVLTFFSSLLLALSGWLFQKKVDKKESQIKEINNAITDGKLKIEQSETRVNDSKERVKKNEEIYHYLSDDQLADRIGKSRKRKANSN